MPQLLLVSVEAVGAGGLPQEDLLPSGLLSQQHESSQAGTGLALKSGVCRYCLVVACWQARTRAGL